MTQQSTEIEVEVVEIDGVAPAMTPERAPSPAGMRGEWQDWRHWQGRVSRLDSRWWRRRGASTLGVAVTAMTNASHAEALAELGGLFPQLIIGQGREARLEGIDACDERLDAANVGVVPDTHESLDERNHGRPLVSGGSAPSAIKAPARGRETVRMVRNFANHQVRRTGECVCW